MEKYEWKKAEKQLYLPKAEPVYIDVPRFSYFSIKGEGSPDDANFAARVEALYAASYGVRMSHKGALAPEGFYEYTVYPLEGLWDLNEEGRKRYQSENAPNIEVLKPYMRYQLMIRQPDFVTQDFAQTLLATLAEKKKNPLIAAVEFISIEEGPSVQMLHQGPYADEPASFLLMEAFARANGLNRASKMHKEIYVSDPRKTASDKLKTVLRFAVTKV